jgi:hypothetical protein
MLCATVQDGFSFILKPRGPNYIVPDYKQRYQSIQWPCALCNAINLTKNVAECKDMTHPIHLDCQLQTKTIFLYRNGDPYHRFVGTVRRNQFWYPTPVAHSTMMAQQWQPRTANLAA